MKFPDAGHVEAATYFRYDLQEKRSTFVIITNDMKAHQENILELFTGPQSQPSSNPFAVLLALVAHYSRFLNQDLSNLSHKAAMMEVKTGMG